MSESLTECRPALLLKPPSGAHFGNIVTAVASAMAREIRAKGPHARFRKVERGQFAANTSA